MSGNKGGGTGGRAAMHEERPRASAALARSSERDHAAEGIAAGVGEPINSGVGIVAGGDGGRVIPEDVLARGVKCRPHVEAGAKSASIEIRLCNLSARITALAANGAWRMAARWSRLRSSQGRFWPSRSVLTSEQCPTISATAGPNRAVTSSSMAGVSSTMSCKTPAITTSSSKPARSSTSATAARCAK